MTLTDIFKACDESGIGLNFYSLHLTYAIEFKRGRKRYTLRFNKEAMREEERRGTDVEEMTEVLVRDIIARFDDLQGYSIKRKEDLEDG